MNRFFISLLFLINALMMYGQQEKISPSAQSNIIKSNIAGYAFRNINLSYERILSRRVSLGGGFGSMLKGGIPFESSLNDNEDLNTADARIKGIFITLEPRIYLGRGFGEGFYISPYFRYTKLEPSDLVYIYKQNIYQIYQPYTPLHLMVK